MIGGAGVAVATTGGDDEKQREDAVLSDAAKRLDVQPSELRDALKAAEDAQLDDDVEAGRLTQEQADAIKRERTEHGTVLGGGPGPRFRPHGPGFGPSFGPGPGGPGDLIGAAASALGLTQAQLLAQLRAGKSIADIAKAQGKSLDSVRSAVRSAVGKKLDKAVADGDVTRAQADELLARMTDHLDEIGSFGGRGFGFGFGHHGPDGPPGGRPADVFGAAAGALGITTEQLFDQLRSGKTLADVAKAHGKSLEDVRSAMKAAVEKHLDEEVAEGDLSKAEAKAMLERMTEHLDDLGRFGHPPRP